MTKSCNKHYVCELEESADWNDDMGGAAGWISPKIGTNDTMNDAMNDNEIGTYGYYREKMLEALGTCIVFDVNMFREAYKNRHGAMFHHGMAPSFLGKGYGRKGVGDYLDECNDIFRKLIINGSIYYLKKDKKTNILRNERAEAHLNFIYPSWLLQMHVLLLIVNLFPTKTTIPIADIVPLIEHIYNTSILKIIECESMCWFFRSIGSKNMIIKNGKVGPRVTLVPTSDSRFEVDEENDEFKILVSEEDKMVEYANSIN